MMEREAILGLQQLGEASMYTQVMALPTPRPFLRNNRFVRHHLREGGVVVLRPYIVPQNLEKKVSTSFSMQTRSSITEIFLRLTPINMHLCIHFTP
jgi:hypothetical protein